VCTRVRVREKSVHTLCLQHTVSLSLSHTHTHTHTHSHTHTHTQTHTLSLALSLSHTHTLSLTFCFSFFLFPPLPPLPPPQQPFSFNPCPSLSHKHIQLVRMSVKSTKEYLESGWEWLQPRCCRRATLSPWLLRSFWTGVWEGVGASLWYINMTFHMSEWVISKSDISYEWVSHR